MPTSPSRFVPASSKAASEIVDRLGRELRLGRPVSTSHRRTYLDTFDGRLFRAGLTLVGEARDGGLLLRLEDLAGDERSRAAVDGLPGLRPELPPGALGAAVARRIGIRRLLALATVELRRRTWRILDGEQKTVVRLVLETGHARSDSGDRRRLKPVLCAEPLRGYEKEHQQVVALLEAETAIAPAAKLPLEAVLGAVGGTAGGYSAKPRLALDPARRADAAVKQVLLALLAGVEASEPGVRRDLDTEFLHDFRVAVRRSRSILGQLEDVFATRTVARFRSELKWLGDVTGPLRDLDVFLLAMPDLAHSLPAGEAARLAPLQDFLERHQRIEHRNLVEALDSTRYRRLLRSWKKFLLRPVPKRPARSVAAQPIGALAADRIWRVYRKVRRRGRSIGPQSPPGAHHRLRIRCKKLRYLLELFGSLFNPDEVRVLVAALKRLQDNLGAFNDAVVQAATLRDFAAQMISEATPPANAADGSSGGPPRVAIDGALLAMGRLIDHLGERRRAEQKAFETRWSHFDSSRNRKLFRRLFKDAAEAGG